MMTGFKPGEIQIMFTPERKSGKSVWAQMVKDLTMPDVKIMDSADVDGKTWYTVQLSIPARVWLREQSKDQWYEHNHRAGIFDISRQLYTALKLKF